MEPAPVNVGDRAFARYVLLSDHRPLMWDEIDGKQTELRKKKNGT
jgi:hypothetical protein